MLYIVSHQANGSDFDLIKQKAYDNFTYIKNL